MHGGHPAAPNLALDGVMRSERHAEWLKSPLISWSDRRHDCLMSMRAACVNRRSFIQRHRTPWLWQRTSPELDLCREKNTRHCSAAKLAVERVRSTRQGL